MEHSLLFSVFIFLAAACLIVPLAGRLKLGSVLGYLVAGVLIGPYGLGFIEHTEAVLHFAEFGVVMMLFIIGLELEPQKLWSLRRSILGLGGLQVALTTLAITALGVWLGYSLAPSLTCGMALSLSSTALVFQMMEEKGQRQTAAGESSFSVLLFQDIAVIPILAIIPMLASSSAAGLHAENWVSSMPGWMKAEVVMGIIVAIVMGGRALSRRVFHYVAATNLREVFTATSLALIVGVTLLMEQIGLSPALGAFVAGMVLASSEYKHTLEADIEPFKNLLLGLFFISVGMGMDFAIFAAHPFSMLGALIALVGIKLAVLFALGRAFGLDNTQNAVFSFLMAQGGEFAFVLFQYATSLGVMEPEHSAFLIMTVALSIATTPFLMMMATRHLLPRFESKAPEREQDTIEESNNSIIIAGYGRFGQVIGRFLHAQGVYATVLENSPDQIDLIRKFGNKAYFGDASRLDFLRSAGADRAKLLMVAVDDPDKALKIVRLAREHFPNLIVYARARNRRHAYELNRAGAHLFMREVFDASLRMAEAAMVTLGHSPAEMRRKAIAFRTHDEETLKTSFAFFEQEPELISFTRQASQELRHILQSDSKAEEEAEKQQTSV